MATLKVLFKAVDEISSKFDSMTRSGEQALEAFESAGMAADGSLGRVSSTATGTARTIDNAANATSELGAAAAEAGSSLGGAADAAAEAADEVGKYGKQSEEAGRQSEEFEKKACDGIQNLQSTLAAAGITTVLKEISTATIEAANSFTEAEKVIIGATGATGQELDKLMESAQKIYASTSAENINDVAAAMTNVQTATGLAGQELEEATVSAISLNDVLGYEVQESTRAASALMKNFGLTAQEAYNLIVIGSQNGADKNGDLLDTLNEYASQYAALGLSAEEFLSSLVEGADAGAFSVDKVGDAVKEFNIRAKDGSDSTAEAFELLGMNADTMTAKFAAGGETASNAFFSVLDALNSMTDPVEKNAAAVALFGTMYEDLEASILPALAGIKGGTLDMHDALGTINNEAKSMGDKWKQAGNSVSTAFSATLSPAIEDASDALAGFVQGTGDFLNDNPAVVAAISALALGVGVFTAGLAAYTLATNVASIATAAWNAVLMANPVFLIITGVVALTAAVVALVAVLASQNDEYEEMTATSKDQYDRLQELNAEYDEACAKYGETSEEASRLRYEMDELNAEFEANKQTVEEFVAECDALVESHNELMDSYNTTTSEIKDNELGTLALIQKLQDLASQNEKTAATEEQMKAIIGELNEELPDLALSYDDVAQNADLAVEAMRKAAEEQAKSEMQAEQQQAYVDLLKEQAALDEQIAKAEANLNSERERRGMWQDESTGQWMNNGYTEDSLWASWTTDLDEYKDALGELNAAYEENQETIAGIEDEWAEVAAAAEEAANQSISYEEGLATAVESIQEELNALCEEYDAAFEAARESIDGQIGLFDTMKTESALSVEEMGAALQSQTEYLNLYAENLQKAAQYGLDEGLIQSLADGSEESAGYINAIIENIEALGTSAESIPSEAATAFVEDFNSKFAEVSQAKDNFAANVASMETDFDARMTEIEGRMNTAIDNMNMSTDAAAAARETISAYCNTIRSMTDEASSAAAAVAQAAKSQLGGISIPTVPGHAEGTTNAEDVYIAGEEGPELIIGAKGSEVFPEEETSRILSAINNRSIETSRGADMPDREPERGETRESGSDKRLTLEINGNGAITVDKGADKATILSVLVENVKPVLMDLIKEEILEEGELAYDF